VGVPRLEGLCWQYYYTCAVGWVICAVLTKSACQSALAKVHRSGLCLVIITNAVFSNHYHLRAGDTRALRMGVGLTHGVLCCLALLQGLFGCISLVS
jgi:hypothetical protein